MDDQISGLEIRSEDPKKSKNISMWRENCGQTSFFFFLFDYFFWWFFWCQDQKMKKIQSVLVLGASGGFGTLFSQVGFFLFAGPI
jgi:hypothetical protein